MGIEHLLAFNLTLLLAIASPGPSLLFLSATALGQGRVAGIAAALGLGLMAALWTGAALIGLDALFAVAPWAYLTLKIGGAAYLIWIAIKIWRAAGDPIGEAPRPGREGRAFRQGLLVNLGNPKSVLFAASVLVVIFPPDLTTAQKALIFFNHLAIEWLLQPALAVMLSSQAVRRRYLGAKMVIDRVSAGVLGALGLRLLLPER
ncbi:MAG: LysE family transporter [Pseudomonadota bacterium]